jgi:ornithine carbamoyltransferase
MRVNDFLTIRDFTTDELTHLLDLAADIKANPDRFRTSLGGKTLAMIFEKPSLRTRVSFDVGIHQLGGFSIYLSPAEINLGKRESVYDVARNLERMVQGIMIRTFGHDIVEKMAEWACIPIINGLTDFSHPCQAMADYLTVQEVKGGVRGVKLAYVGDGNNVAHSLIEGAALCGAHLVLATPAEFAPDPAIIAAAQARAPESGAVIEVVRDPREAVSGADAVYTDTWISMGMEADREARERAFAGYLVDTALMDAAKSGAVFLHCLPAYRGKEVAGDVLDGPRSRVWDEAENRLWTEQALLYWLITGDLRAEPAH